MFAGIAFTFYLTILQAKRRGLASLVFPAAIWDGSEARSVRDVRSFVGSSPTRPSRGATFACFHNPANDSKQDGSREQTGTHAELAERFNAPVC